tara:strand:+ start:892 stop:1740 length:849 start_codon:yes stop_codon:yes gene_type:complete
MKNIIPKKAYKIKFLNILGLQPIRYIIAKLALNFRKNKFKNINNSNLNLRGIEFFYSSEEEIKKLTEDVKNLKSILLDKKEFKNFHPKRITLIDGSTIVDRIEFSFEEMEKSDIFQNLCKYLSGNKIWDLLSNDFGSKIYLCPDQIIWFDKITYGQSSDVSQWHTDTFFDNYKYWFFPEGISNKKNIPMNYLPKSHKFSFKRIIFEYFCSLTMKKNTDLSWRLNKHFFKIFGIKPVNNECPEFTGFLANTHGFHSRATVKNGATRIQLHMTIRPTDPFSFFT